MPLHWDIPAAVSAVFTTRNGGESYPPYASFNLGVHVGDDIDAVSLNRQRLQSQTGVARIHWLKQIHGTGVVRIGAANNREQEADASWTDIPGQALVIQVADCMPVLVSDKSGGKIGAAHAGWRGLCEGVIPALLQEMDLSAADAMVWLGPCIGPRAFEVGPEVQDAFAGSPAFSAIDIHQAFSPARDDRRWADLHMLARLQLQQLGCTSVAGEERCTYSEPETFYSYRRDGITGRQAALIWINSD